MGLGFPLGLECFTFIKHTEGYVLRVVVGCDFTTKMVITQSKSVKEDTLTASEHIVDVGVSTS